MAYPACDVCGKPAVFACPCQHRFYCTKECQRTNWRRDGHKENCALRAVRATQEAQEREAQHTRATRASRRNRVPTNTTHTRNGGIPSQALDSSIMEGARIDPDAQHSDDTRSVEVERPQPTRVSQRQGGSARADDTVSRSAIAGAVDVQRNQPVRASQRQTSSARVPAPSLHGDNSRTVYAERTQPTRASQRNNGSNQIDENPSRDQSVRVETQPTRASQRHSSGRRPQTTNPPTNRTQVPRGSANTANVSKTSNSKQHTQSKVVAVAVEDSPEDAADSSSSVEGITDHTIDLTEKTSDTSDADIPVVTEKDTTHAHSKHTDDTHAVKTYAPRRTRAEAAKSTITGRLRNATKRGGRLSAPAGNPKPPTPKKLTPRQSPARRERSVEPALRERRNDRGKASKAKKSVGQKQLDGGAEQPNTRHKRALSKPKTTGLYEIEGEAAISNGTASRVRVSPAVVEGTMPAAPSAVEKNVPVVIVERNVEPVGQNGTQRDQAKQQVPAIVEKDRQPVKQSKPVRAKVTPREPQMKKQPVVSEEVPRHTSKYKPRTTRAHGGAPEIDLMAPLPDERHVHTNKTKPKPKRPGESRNRKGKQAAKKTAKSSANKPAQISAVLTNELATNAENGVEVVGEDGAQVVGDALEDANVSNEAADKTAQSDIASALVEIGAPTGVAMDVQTELRITESSGTTGTERDEQSPVTTEELPTVVVSVNNAPSRPKPSTRRGTKRSTPVDVDGGATTSTRSERGGRKRIRKELESSMFQSEQPSSDPVSEAMDEAGMMESSVQGRTDLEVDMQAKKNRTVTPTGEVINSKKSPNKRQLRQNPETNSNRRTRYTEDRVSKQDTVTINMGKSHTVSGVPSTEEAVPEIPISDDIARVDLPVEENVVLHVAAKKRSPRASRRRQAQTSAANTQATEAISQTIEVSPKKVSSGNAEMGSNNGSNDMTRAVASKSTKVSEGTTAGDSETESSTVLNTEKQARRPPKGHTLHQLPRPKPKARPLPKIQSQGSVYSGIQRGANAKELVQNTQNSDNHIEVTHENLEANEVTGEQGEETTEHMPVERVITQTTTATEVPETNAGGTQDTVLNESVSAAADVQETENATETGRGDKNATVAPVSKSKAKSSGGQKRKMSGSDKENSDEMQMSNTGMRVSNRQRRARENLTLVDLDQQGVGEKEPETEIEMEEEDDHLCRICDIRFEELYELEFHNEQHFDVTDDLWVDPKPEKA